LQSALRGHGRPEIFNSDQGAPFTRHAFTAMLTAAGMRISRDGQRRAMDNIRGERRWRTVTYEAIDLKETLKNDSISLASPSESVFFDLSARFNPFLGSF
jgi:transposase InsO family protein